MRFVRALLNRVSSLGRYISSRAVLARSGARVEGKVSIARHVRLRATDGAIVRLAEGVEIGPCAEITAKFGRVEIGARSFVGSFSVICARESILIGADCLIAEHVSIRDQDHRFGPGLITARAGFITSPVVIGDNVWIGAKATVTKGVRIGDNAVVGANSVVTHDIPENSVAIGVPARVVRTIGDAT